MDIFVGQLMAVSMLTGLVTEAIKAFLDEQGIAFCSNNILAGIVSVIVSVLVLLAQYAYVPAGITPEGIVGAAALIIFGWLVAMLGYDKIVQAINQIKEG